MVVLARVLPHYTKNYYLFQDESPFNFLQMLGSAFTAESLKHIYDRSSYEFYTLWHWLWVLHCGLSKYCNLFIVLLGISRHHHWVVRQPQQDLRLEVSEVIKRLRGRVLVRCPPA